MALTDPSTGLRRSRDKKMEASRARNGSMPLATLAIGRTIRKTVSAYTSTRTGISMRGFGKETSVMVREHIGETKAASFVANTPEIGSRIRSMAEAPSSTRTETVMMATGLPACLKVRAE